MTETTLHMRGRNLTGSNALSKVKVYKTKVPVR